MAAKTIVVDFDGTLVENKWPGIGNWMPGAIKAMLDLHHAGYKIILFSARLSSSDPFTGNDRPPGEVMTEVQKVRSMLDKAGLTFIQIWTKAGKPGGAVYIDDRAERYNGRPGSWAKMVRRILIREGSNAES